MHSYARHLCNTYTTFSVLQTAVQKIVPEGEWDAFLASLRTPLPTSFRISGSGKFAATLRDHLENDFFSQFASGPLVVRDFFPLVKAVLFKVACKPGTKSGIVLQVDGEELAPPRALEWYPNRLAWFAQAEHIRVIPWNHRLG